MRRLPLLLLAITLALWVLAVPMLHGHLPGATVHDHGATATTGSDAGDALDVVGVAESGSQAPLADERAPLPLATALGLLLVVALPLLRHLLGPAGDPLRSAVPRPAAQPRRSTPVARHEVIVV